MYAIIHVSDEDGHEVCLLKDADELQEFLENPESYCGVTEFRKEIIDPRNMSNGQAMLIKFELLVPKEKTKAWKL